ncbi:bacilliredoxin BrxA [Staphylococcus pasteuri]|uniref:bacilliredoxin BrxA n=1 Tax=Staphylococcus pasteuri TaxID=45972 RepID=UPI0012B8388B|nr:bacilliredoxin BrxA [Staphylococcus pasteuri]
MNAYDQYMKELAQQMRSELTNHEFESLESSESVNQYMNNVNEDDTTFVVINSTCGCAAGLARPAAVAVAEQNEAKPTHKVTVFAGQDKEATETMREYIQQVPSSPSFALFKGQNLVHFMPREHIEGRDINDIAMDLKDAFDDYCETK